MLDAKAMVTTFNFLQVGMMRASTIPVLQVSMEGMSKSQIATDGLSTHAGTIAPQLPVRIDQLATPMAPPSPETVSQAKIPSGHGGATRTGMEPSCHDPACPRLRGACGAVAAVAAPPSPGAGRPWTPKARKSTRLSAPRNAPHKVRATANTGSKW